MNKLGILIDLSHCGHKTVMDAIEALDGPVVFTHTNCYTLCKHIRCKTDGELIAAAEKGGYIGLTILPFFVSEKETAVLNDFLDHVDHAVELVGVDYAGIGTDYTGQADIPKQLSDLYTSLLSTIGFRPEHRVRFGVSTQGSKTTLIGSTSRGAGFKGISNKDVQKVLGENFLRVFEKVVG